MKIEYVTFDFHSRSIYGTGPGGLDALAHERKTY